MLMIQHVATRQIRQTFPPSKFYAIRYFSEITYLAIQFNYSLKHHQNPTFTW